MEAFENASYFRKQGDGPPQALKRKQKLLKRQLATRLLKIHRIIESVSWIEHTSTNDSLISLK